MFTTVMIKFLLTVKMHNYKFGLVTTHISCGYVIATHFSHLNRKSLCLRTYNEVYSGINSVVLSLSEPIPCLLEFWWEIWSGKGNTTNRREARIATGFSCNDCYCLCLVNMRRGCCDPRVQRVFQLCLYQLFGLCRLVFSCCIYLAVN